MLKAKVPVVAVTAVRTGAGKSQTTRRGGGNFDRAGAAGRRRASPDAYGNWWNKRCSDLRRRRIWTVIVHHRRAGRIRAAHRAGQRRVCGRRLRRDLEQAQAEADVLLWDGGNNDFPFYVPDLHITVADPHRAGHETAYHPGETNVRSADG